MNIPYFVVHSFTDRVFSGNPAGVCPIEQWPPDELLQQIAFENDLAETAFFAQEGFAFRLRWFAPLAEVDLCGHATLAAAFVLCECLGYEQPSIRFETRSGALTVVRQGRKFAMDFPSLKMRPVPISPEIVAGLGARPIETFESMDQIAVFADENEVASLQPNLDILKQVPGRGVLATAIGRNADYVLRCFGPKVGIPEDPATGSAQSMLAPYWSARLGRSELVVRQLSARGADMSCKVNGDRVEIAGHAALYLQGRLSI
jgi:predicted PhzF superfamily epimerase YddE/YHI9